MKTVAQFESNNHAEKFQLPNERAMIVVVVLLVIFVALIVRRRAEKNQKPK